MPTTLPRVLILCTGNSCRSQMAEGALRQLAGKRLEACSAGTEPAAEVHPLAVEVMAEVGIDIRDQQPKHVQQFLDDQQIAFLIAVCGDAEHSCPTISGGTMERLFWPFPDPARFTGTVEQRRVKFREVRDQIIDRLRQWLATDPLPPAA